MSVYDDVLQAVVGLANDTTSYAVVTIGSLPADNGICMAWGPGSLNTFLNKKAAVTMTAVLNAKNTNQQAALDALSNIHTALNMMTTYPTADNFQITNIETNGPPSYLSREQNSQWLYGSSLKVKFFLKGA